MKAQTGRAWARLAGTAAALVVASLAGPLTAANAADPQATLTVTLPSQFVVSNDDVAADPGKYFPIDISNTSPTPAADVKLTIDASGLDPEMVKVAIPDGWDTCVEGSTAGTFDCALGDLVGTNGVSAPDLSVPLLVVAKPGVAPGDAGPLTVTVSAANAATVSATQKITVLDPNPPQVDLVTWADDVQQGAGGPISPGSSAAMYFFVLNHGNTGAADITLDIALPDHVTFESVPEGCVLNTEKTSVTCKSDPGYVLPPGMGFDSYAEDGNGELVPEFIVTVAPDAPGPIAQPGGTVSAFAGEAADVPPEASTAKSPSIFAPKAATKQQALDADEGDNTAAFKVIVGANPTDLAISATSANGAVGSTVTVRVTVDNKGPSIARDTVITIVAPTGTELVNPDEACTAVTAGRKYTCAFPEYPVGSGYGEFQFKITSSTIGTDGLATVSTASRDTDASNNSAKIVITTGGSGGGLPVTGARAGLIGGAGAVVLAGGIGIYLLNRRRRVVLVTPDSDTSAGGEN